MELRHHLKNSVSLGEYDKNVGTMLLRCCSERGDSPAAAERRGDQFHYWSWNDFVDDVLRVSAYFLDQGLPTRAKIGFVSLNGYWRLVSEMACMANGMVSVPVFAGYPNPTIEELLKFTEVEMLVTDKPTLPEQLRQGTWKHLFLIGRDTPYLPTLGSERRQQITEIWKKVDSRSLMIVMFTSGTSGLPKGVQLSHRNILSQQKALELVWKAPKGMRFLSYLPWHHSFGGFFERFFALSTGGCLAVDDSWGKNIERLLENYTLIQPHVYFSVPKIYQEIITRVLASSEVESVFFHKDLKFVFTAAAPLPLSISDVFKSKGVPVAEGWGLTETSPCCTLTELSLDRKPGVVGLPIPGVEVALDDIGEILVRGENLMSGYFNNPTATNSAIDGQGWFHTGDLGEVTPQGVKILSRKDRMFKLSNGEKVFPTEIEERVKAKCKFIKYAYVFGKGQKRISMLVFPNFELFGVGKPKLDDSGCKYPCHSQGLNDCLCGCVNEINSTVQAGFERVGRVIIVPRELTLENNELTPSFKLVPRVIEERYKDYMSDSVPKDAYLFQINPDAELNRTARGIL